MFQLDETTSLNEIEHHLRSELHKVDLVGELPITKETFQKLGYLLRRNIHLASNYQNIHRVPMALFSVSMVFCARYSHNPNRNFWEPYSQQVWELPSNDQMFQNACRNHFDNARRWLKKEYGFYFAPPREETRQTVKDIFTHAIIPSYLQDDFGNWLKGQDWHQILAHAPEDLPYILRESNRLRYVASTLQHFITDEVTAPIATRLIRTLATAAQLYRDGTSSDEILKMLARKPIEKDLWLALSEALQQQEVVLKTSIRSPKTFPRLRWCWSLEKDQMVLQVGSFHITNSAMIPERWVWCSPDEDKPDNGLSIWVIPWRISDNNWFLEDVTMAEGPVPGKLLLLDEEGHVLKQYNVPAVPKDPIQIYRISHQNTLGIPIDPQHHILTDGEWLISYTHGHRLTNDNGQPVLIRQSYPVPSPLDEYGHVYAGQFSLLLPVQVETPNGTHRFEKTSGTHLIDTKLEGQQVSGLAKTIPPVFTDDSLKLIINQFDHRHVLRFLLTLTRAGDILRSYSFEELNEQNRLHFNENRTEATIDLTGMVTQGRYQLEIRYNLQSLTNEPQQFVLIPGLEIISPLADTLYTPNYPPQVFISGILPEQIRSSGEVSSDDDGVLISWTDLRTNCQAVIDIAGIPISLEWDVPRFYAWTVPDIEHGFLTQAQLEETIIYFRGPRNEAFQIWVNEGSRRALRLNMKGMYDLHIMQDQLREMLREEKLARASIFVEVQGQQWKLFDILRRPEMSNVRASFDHRNKTLQVDYQTQEHWQGRFTWQVQPWGGGKSILITESETLSVASFYVSYNLPPGFYQLDILAEGQPIQFDEVPFVIVDDGQIEQHGITIRAIEMALRWLSKTDEAILPNEAAIAFVFLLWKRQTPLSKRELFQLAQLPTDQLMALPMTIIEEVWSPLIAMSNAHDQKRWETYYGALPEWVQFNRYAHFNLESPRQRVRVFAENLPEHNSSGQGFAEIQLTDSPKVRSYVCWEQVFDEKYTLAFILSSKENEYDFLIPQTTTPYFYVCHKCNRIVSIGEPPTNAQKSVHRHGAGAARIEQHSTLNRHAHLMPHTLVASVVHSVERQIIERELIDKFLIGLPKHAPSGLSPYGLAVFDWVTRYHQQPEIITAFTQPNQAFEALKHQIYQEHRGNPMMLAARHILQLLEPSRPADALQRMDQIVFLLALCLRLPIYGMQQKHFGTTELADLLYTAEKACPLLLKWALAWTEIILLQNTIQLSEKRHESH